MDNELVKKIPGAAAFRDWHGWFPGFHDVRATMISRPDGSFAITLKTHQLADIAKLDGSLKMGKQFRVDLSVSGIIDTSFPSAPPFDVTLDGASFVEHEEGIWMEFDDGGDFWCFILAQNVELAFEPVELRGWSAR